jgi:molybdenum cofactor cytidylyltransferase
MKFGSVPIEQSLGGIVAHAVKHEDFVLKKGTTISAGDIRNLQQHGIAEVVVARFEPGDMTEDEAARILAEAAAGAHVRLDPPFTGRTNLFAEAAGILQVDAARIDAVNDIDDAVTIATLPALKPVKLGEMIGTVKIIPFAVPDIVLKQAVSAANDAIRIAPYQPKRIAVISTLLPGLKRSVVDKTLRVLQDRLDQSGAAPDAVIIGHDMVAHATAPLAAAIDKAGSADLVIIFGASAITDHRDVIPAAIEQSGGTIEHFGMPVDPGNLLLIGSRHNARIIGAPGCARSPKENGFDWVLNRFLADVPVSKADIRKMGVGGLLMEIIARPQPRAPEAEASAPQTAILVLAAGRSSRMGSNKLTEIWNGKPILRHTVETALASRRGGPVTVVTGHDPDRAKATLAGLDGLRLVHNSAYADGLSTSLRQGLAGLPETVSAALVMLGDMPRLTPALIDRLILAFGDNPDAKAVAPVVAGQRGNPVLIARSGFSDCAKLTGDQGARKLLDQWGDQVIDVALDDDALLFDVDTPEALQRLRKIN